MSSLRVLILAFAGVCLAGTVFATPSSAAPRSPQQPAAAPKPPTNLVVDAHTDTDSFAVSWQETSTGVTGFDVRYFIVRKNDSIPDLVYQYAHVPANSTSINQVGVTEGWLTGDILKACYGVRALSGHGSHQQHSVWSKTECAVAILPAPYNVTATWVNDQTIKLTWQYNWYVEDGFIVHSPNEYGPEVLQGPTGRSQVFGGIPSDNIYVLIGVQAYIGHNPTDVLSGEGWFSPGKNSLICLERRTPGAIACPTLPPYGGT